MTDMNKIPYHIGRRVGYQGPRCPVGNQAGNVKYATGKQLRTRFSIGAWNVRKMKESGKLHTICDEMDRIKLEILGISETNWTKRGSFRTHENKTVIYSGKDEGHGYSNGVAVILSKESAKSLIGYNPISDRILQIRIRAKPYYLSVIQCYASTVTASDEEMEDFYSRLQESLDNTQNRDITIAMG